jgi:hypothetical protein
MLNDVSGSILNCYERIMTNNESALGFLVTLYATLITLFGLAWVLFLIGTFSLFSTHVS